MKKRLLSIAIGISISLSISGCGASMQGFTDGISNGFNNAVSSVSNAMNGNKSNGNGYTKYAGLVKDINSTNVLSKKDYIRGMAKLKYAHIPRNIEQNENIITLRASGGARMLKGILTNSGRSARLQKDSSSATKSIFKLSSEDTVYSDAFKNSPAYFNLSSIDKYETNEDDMYKIDITTHIKVPDNLVKKGKVYFSGDSPVKYYSLVENKNVLTTEDVATICYTRVNEEFTSKGKTNHIKVKKGNILDFRSTCYFAGDLKGRVGFGRLAETIQPNWYVQSSSSSKSTDKYKLTSMDMFLYKSETETK